MPHYRVSLDGLWRFRHENGVWRQAVVPMPWQAQFADLRHSFGHAVYERSVPRPDIPDGHIARLHFGAVSDVAAVTLNGHLIAQHEGGYLPFTAEIPADLWRDDNLLSVACDLPDGASAPNFAEIPHGKQSWYGPLGGIWQSATLEILPNAHVAHCAIGPDIGG